MSKKRRQGFSPRGEEFGVSVIRTSPQEAEKIAEKILDSIKNLKIEHKLNSAGVVTVSVGVAFSWPETPNLDTIYKSADDALYKAKENGRNQFILS
jgi:diguanylate cyclase